MYKQISFKDLVDEICSQEWEVRLACYEKNDEVTKQEIIKWNKEFLKEQKEIQTMEDLLESEILGAFEWDDKIEYICNVLSKLWKLKKPKQHV